MAEIELKLANMSDFPLLSKIDLGFESGHVWKSQVVEDFGVVSIVFQSIKLPRVIQVPFQSLTSDGLENMIKRQEVLVARLDHTIVAFIHVEIDVNTNRLFLKNGGVKPEYRRNGIGGAVLESVQQLARKNNIRQVISVLQAKNADAIRFFTLHGFQFCGYQEFYYPNMEIALFFSKNVV